jgi:hypothetical protein
VALAETISISGRGGRRLPSEVGTAPAYPAR